MLNLKKTAVAVLAFSSSAVFAGTMGPVCTPGNVTVPCEHTAWDLGVYALYLDVSHSSNSGYQGTTAANGLTNYAGYDDKYRWGFKLEGSYHFNTGNDINVNWYHLDAKTRSLDIKAGFTRRGINDTLLAGNERRTNKWDAVNFEFAQHVDFGEFQDVRFHGGAQYAQLSSTMSGSAAGRSQSAAFRLNGLANSKFNGFGPRIGADYTYNWGNGLGIYAKGAAAILVGTSKFSTNVVTNEQTFLANINARGSLRNIVPEFEGKLGATYTYAMAQGDLSLDAGWMWVDYVGAHHGITHDWSFVANNFALQGPYVGLNWVGNV